MNTHVTVEGKVAPLLSSLARFTEQREQEALSISLGQAIRDLTEAQSVTLYRLLMVETEPHLLAIAAWHQGEINTITDNLPQTMPLNAMPMFEAAFASHTITKSESATGHVIDLVLPLCMNMEQVEAFFFVEGSSHNEISDRVLPLLLEIYRNFRDLLRDNQHDLLTGLLNRKTFDTRISNIQLKLNSPHHRKTDQPEERYCLAIIDIDHFKRINDNFGHLYGDEVLLLLSNMMQESFRQGDALFRFGGEEFVVLLQDIDVEQAHDVVDRFRTTVESREFPQVGRVTISCGVTAIQPGELPPRILDRADKALYYAKENGRNMVCIYESLVSQGKMESPEVSSGSIELF